MSDPRIKSPQRAVYHVFARVVQKRRLLSPAAKEAWVAALHRAAGFSGVEIITYCALDNHFHVLVRVDPPKARSADDLELLRRFEILYGSSVAQWCQLDAEGLARAFKEGPPLLADRLRQRLLARMGDVSEFMRTLRMRYTKWFNQTHGTVGTLWAERFGSVLIEDAPWLTKILAAYVDLNGVRAGLADHPQDYRWCGHAEAIRGNSTLRENLGACCPGEGGPQAAFKRYTAYLNEALRHPRQAAPPPSGQTPPVVETSLLAKSGAFTEALILASAQHPGITLLQALLARLKAPPLPWKGMLPGAPAFMVLRHRPKAQPEGPEPADLV